MVTIDERGRKLLKLGTEVGRSDEEVQEWNKWFIQKTEDFTEEKLTVNSYKAVLERYETFLKKKGHSVPISKDFSISSKEDSDIAEKIDTSPFSIICPNCAGGNSRSGKYCIFCGHDLPRTVKPKSPKAESSTDPTPQVETPDKQSSELIITEKSVQEEGAKLIEETEIRHQSEQELFDPKPKPVSKSIQKEEVISKPAKKKDSLKIDTRKVPEVKTLRKKQFELVDIVTFGRLTIFSSIIFVIVLIFITIANPDPLERYPVGMLVFAFLLLVAGIIFDVLRWKNTDLSALGAVIFLIGVGMIFCVPLAYTFYLNIPDFVWFFWNIIAIIFVIGGAGARWSDYDTKIVDMATIAIAYWQNYEKRAAIRKVIELIVTFLIGIGKSIASGIRNFPKRAYTVLRRVAGSFSLYIRTNIRLITKAIGRILRTSWRNIHWFGLLAMAGYVLDPTHLFGDSNFYKNTQLIIIIVFFFFLGVVTSRSEKIKVAVSNTRTLVLKGTISAYSMLSGSKMRKEEAVFCSRCLRGVHHIEFAELQQVEGTENPPCPYCNYGNWASFT